MNQFAEHYNQDALVYGVSSTRKKKIFEMIDLHGGPVDILDIGCGIGLLGKELRSKGNKVFGVDISVFSIEKAKKNLDAAFVCDIQNDKLPFPEGAFDEVLFTEVIEHLPFPEKTMAEISRVLKPGGFAVITTPNFLVWSNRIHMLFGRFEYTDTGFLDRGHVHFFTMRSMIRAIEEAGLRVAAWNNVYHGKIPEFIGRLRPSLFAFQFVVKAVKI
jgi:2-polyprenyl-3-methyl-5-hydroxy-6-metoxy-1,4-benzoquinol methylase